MLCPEAKAILTKKSMGALSFVEKTTLPRNYVPDYVVFFHGLPVCVVEAKVPESREHLRGSDRERAGAFVSDRR